MPEVRLDPTNPQRPFVIADGAIHEDAIGEGEGVYIDDVRTARAAALAFLDNTSVAEQLSGEGLAAIYATFQDLLGDINHASYDIRKEMSGRMDEDEADEIKIRANFGRSVLVERKDKVSMNVAIDGPLSVLKDYIEAEEFDALLTAQAATPATPPRKFNMTKVNPLARRGKRFRDAIKDAETNRVAETTMKIQESKS